MAQKYQDLHRFFLQWIMTQRLVTGPNARQMYRRACELYNAPYSDDNFLPSIALINKQLKPLSMEIRSGRSEDTGVVHFAFVNCFEDEYSKVATEFSANEIAFFKKVLDSIILSNDGHVSSMVLINLGTDLAIKINASNSESLLFRFIEENWLTETDGEVSLGPRTMIELSVYLKDIYKEDIPDCKLCMDIVIKGQTCANCGVRIHMYCSNRYFKDRPQITRKCPGCQANWLHEIPVIQQSNESF